MLDDKLQKKASRLEGELRKEGKKHAERIQELQRSQQTAFQSFQGQIFDYKGHPRSTEVI